MGRPIPVLLGAALTVLVIAAAACSDSGSSTAPSILTIEPGLPTGWSPVGSNSATYVLGVDKNTVHGGKLALAIGGIDTSSLRFAGVGQFIKADSYRGKRVRLRAWVARHDDLARKLAVLKRRFERRFRIVFETIRELDGATAEVHGRTHRIPSSGSNDAAG